MALLRKRLIIGVSAALMTLGASSVLAAQQTLSNALEFTLKTFPDPLIAKARLGAAKADVKEAQGGLLPTVDVFLAGGPEYSNNPATRSRGNDSTLFRQEGDIVASQLLYDGGRVTNSIRQSKYLEQSAGYQVSETDERTAFRVVEVYLDVTRLGQVLALSQNNVRAHEDTLAKAQKRLKAGAGRKSDVQLAEARLSAARAQYIATEGELKDAKEDYERVVGRKPLGLVRPRNAGYLLPSAQNKAIQIALRDNPSMLVAKKDYNASGAAEASATAQVYFPVVSLEVSSENGNELDGVKGRNNDAKALVVMDYNLFRGGSDKARQEAAQQEQIVAQQTIERIRRQVTEDVQLSWTALRTSKERIPELEENVTQSTGVVESYNKQFVLGQRTMIDLLNVENESFRAKVDLVNGRFAVMRSNYRVMASMGWLVQGIFASSSYQA